MPCIAEAKKGVGVHSAGGRNFQGGYGGSPAGYQAGGFAGGMGGGWGGQYGNGGWGGAPYPGFMPYGPIGGTATMGGAMGGIGGMGNVRRTIVIS